MALKFKIAGIDASINGTAVTILELDETFNIERAYYRGYATTLKQHKLDPENLTMLNKKSFKFDYEQYVWNANNFASWVDGVDYAAIEDYAFAANGLVFNMAENTSLMKNVLWNGGIPLRKYEPTVIKKFATGVGNADKNLMMKTYHEKHDHVLDLSNLEDGKVHPKEDIVDSFFIAMLLRIELMLRYGIIDMRHLSPEIIWCFNRVSKSNPINILNQEFIERT